MKSKQKKKGVVDEPPDPRLCDDPGEHDVGGGRNIQPDYETFLGSLRTYLKILSDSDEGTSSKDLLAKGYYYY